MLKAGCGGIDGTSGVGRIFAVFVGRMYAVLVLSFVLLVLRGRGSSGRTVSCAEYIRCAAYIRCGRASRPDRRWVPAGCSVSGCVGVCRCRRVVWVVTQVVIVRFFWRVVVIDIGVCMHIIC